MNHVFREKCEILHKLDQATFLSKFDRNVHFLSQNFIHSKDFFVSLDTALL